MRNRLLEWHKTYSGKKWLTSIVESWLVKGTGKAWKIYFFIQKFDDLFIKAAVIPSMYYSGR